jgi:UrcA family protein
MRRTSLVCLSALVLSAVALPAMAQDVADTHQRVVYIGDVNQGTIEGADIILDRIHNASTSVCRDDMIGSVANVAGTEINRCQIEATEVAVHDLDNGIVTARYHGLTPQVIVSDNDYDDAIVVKKPG